VPSSPDVSARLRRIDPSPLPLFDVYLVVDWSASSVPKQGRDSIWVAVLEHGAAAASLHNPPTRRDADLLIETMLDTYTDRRVLLGIDVGLGYPHGFAAAAGLGTSPAWSAVWQHLAHALDDQLDNTNNRFDVAAALNARTGEGPGPFWGTTSTRHVTPTLARTKAPGFPTASTPPLAEFRHTERVLRDLGRRPASVWQLAGAGSVGSQSLTAIPLLHRLRQRASSHVRVWPFDTGLVDDPTLGDRAAVVVAEVWPSAVEVDASLHAVRDAAQVTALGTRLAALDAVGGLGRLFAPQVPGHIVDAVLDEEGWVLGVPGVTGSTDAAPEQRQVTWMM
jgi:precorrin-8X/cobalt-precorrin-8 methylmutase